MATASSTIIPGYTLKATTPAPGEAPVTYAVNGVVVGTDITADITAGARGLFFNTVPNLDGTFTITAGQSNTRVFTGTQAQAASFTAGIVNAVGTVLNSIHTSVVTLPPPPPPVTAPPTITTNPAPVTATTPAPTPAPGANAAPKTAAANTTDPSRTGNAAPTSNAAPQTAAANTTDPSRSGAPAANAAPSTGVNAPSAQPPNTGITGARQSATAQATAQDQANFGAARDWRVRLALAPGANYLYKANPPGILQPLVSTDGVIFPYTPTINVQYAANYDAQSVTHSNYKIYQYQSSSVDSVTVSGDFTCQDVFEANYLLAVIHFFRSMTKMFYGQDDNPKNGTPPPLCYIYGMGGFQFDALPLAITGFTYNLPNDVDYIPTTGASPAGSLQPSVSNNNTNKSANFLSGSSRLLGIGVGAGGTPRPPTYPSTPSSINQSTTWVPTKIQLSVTCAPVQSRNMISNNFSLKNYGTGDLLRGSKNLGGGMW